MKIKYKILLSFGFLFLIIILLGAVGSYWVKNLGKDAQEILKDNNRTLNYMENINSGLDHILEAIITGEQVDEKNLETVKENLQLQKENITEPGEKELTQELEHSINSVLTAIAKRDQAAIVRSIFDAKRISRTIYGINQKKIISRNDRVTKNAKQVYLYITGISFGAFVVAFFFTIGVPSYLVKPLKEI